jgi:hypothetical protein
MQRDEWLDWLQNKRVDIAKLPDSDPRKADMWAQLDSLEAIEKLVDELDQRDPEAAKQLLKRFATKIASISKG